RHRRRNGRAIIAVAPSANQSFIPNTSWQILLSSTCEPAASTTPENSCPKIAPVLLSPLAAWEVGYQSRSVGVTPAACTRTSTSLAAGRGTGASSAIIAGWSMESLKRMTFIVFIVDRSRLFFRLVIVEGAPEDSLVCELLRRLEICRYLSALRKSLDQRLQEKRAVPGNCQNAGS